jgi:SAM-dependent methyltransferase
MTNGRHRWICICLGSLACLLLAGCSTTKSADRHGADEPSASGHAGHQKKRFVDPEKRAEEWNDPERDEWQRPEDLVEAMAIEQGMTVADVGAGTGYFVPFLSRAVGEGGRVLAVDIEEAMLEYVDDLAADRGLENVETVLADKTDTNLDKNSTDRILIVNTWHHIPNRGDYARHLRERLTDGGEVWIVDYRHDTPGGPPEKHRLEPEQIVSELERGGLEAEVHPLELERQHVVVGHLE